MSHALTPPADSEPELLSQSSSTFDGYTRQFKDPVHDYIEIPPYLSCIVDTPQFQRLRELKQLGSAYYVFPGASHNRFEHCLGVAHLAKKMVEGLQIRQPELNISQRDVKCVAIAGLCHDLGHGPFSHVWDNKFLPAVSPGSSWSHEMGSEMMFDAICADYDVDLSIDEQNFVKDLIRGRPNLTRDRVPAEKPFLFEIVANSRNGIDVDKFDYIQRDTHARRKQMNDVTSRLIRSARVIDNQICYADKDWYMVSQLFESRFSLHKMIYNHKSSKAVELMIIDALVKAEPFLHLADKIHDAEEYLYLNDSVLLQIERSKDLELAESREIIRRIRTRQLYKHVDVYMFPAEHRATLKKLTPSLVADSAKGIKLPEGEDVTLAAEDVAIDVTLIHLGMKDKRPVDLVKFYGKRNPNISHRAPPECVSHVFSESSQELCLRVFTRNPDKFGIVQASCRAALDSLFPPDDKASAPEPPTTPKMSPALVKPTPFTAQYNELRRSSLPRSVSTPFAPNPFTTVPPNYRETNSPQAQAINGKRSRGESPHVSPDWPESKRLTVSWPVIILVPHGSVSVYISIALLMHMGQNNYPWWTSGVFSLPALCGTLGIFSTFLTGAMGYQNPIISGFNPDPTILRTGSDYFVATSTFEFFPGVPIYHSKDLIKWETIGHASTGLTS
ncbi:glycoside hydrolase family 43 protein [Ceratobasidium sp. AG-Ba]|nr:glycoside hydrolase family 43 protein [Ceratobasidium sp. AG-Ba]